MKEWAARFADQLLKDNLQLEEFQVSLIDYEHFDEIVERLQELGCEVKADKPRRRLTVVVPRGGFGGGRNSEVPTDKRAYVPSHLPRSAFPLLRDDISDGGSSVIQAVLELLEREVANLERKPVRG